MADFEAFTWTSPLKEEDIIYLIIHADDLIIVLKNIEKVNLGGPSPVNS